MANVDIKIPEMGESITEVVIASWFKNEGDEVMQDEIIAELETDKVTVEINAPESGVMGAILKKAGDTVKVHEVVGYVTAGAVSSKPVKAPAAAVLAPAQPTALTENKNETIPPAAKKMIADNKLDAGQIQGSGKRGQILKEDVVNHMQGGNGGTASAPQAAAAPKPTKPSIQRASGERETVKPMSKLRQAIATRLVQVQQTAAILTTFNEIDMHNLMSLRSKYKDQFLDTHGVKLGFMGFFTKAVIHALQAFPAINAEIRGTDMIYKNYFDIGVAVGGPKGLVVPVVRDADQLSLAEIEAEIMRLALKVKDGQVDLKDLEGGTFTITNGGIYGSMMSTPIINPPQSGILGIHNIVKRPIALGSEVVIRPMMYVALSYDHRIVDGKEAVQFLVKIKEAIEDPARLLLEV